MEAILTTLALVACALLLPGIINRTRALLSGRKGIRFFQHIHNVRVMLSKGVVMGNVTTLHTRLAPSVYLGSIFTAMLFIPLGGCGAMFGFDGDVVMVAYLLALSRFSLILAALDTGSSFEGMGASRDALYGAMIEPALFIIGGTLALVSGAASFSGMFNALGSMSISVEMAIVMFLLVFVIMRVISAECGRIPMDDPRTHLELTMIHEVMILDYSGVDLAMVTVGGWLRMALLAVLGGGIFASVADGGWWLAFCVALGMAVVVGVTESFIARNKLSRNTTYLFAVTSIAFVLFMVAFILKSNISIE